VTDGTQKPVVGDDEYPGGSPRPFAARAPACRAILKSSRPVTRHMPRPRRRPKPDRHRALELLASCRDGCTEALMLAHGFSIDMMVELVQAGLATATAERVVAGSRTIEVARVRITEAGRQALESTVQQ
jgi:hypothetical protein